MRVFTRSGAEYAIRVDVDDTIRIRRVSGPPLTRTRVCPFDNGEWWVVVKHSLKKPVVGETMQFSVEGVEAAIYTTKVERIEGTLPSYIVVSESV
jgi:hypothetical protein